MSKQEDERLYNQLYTSILHHSKSFTVMTDFEFMALSEQDRIRLLSTADYIAKSEEVPAMLFLVEQFFVEVFCDIDGNLLTAITYSSSAILPDQYLDWVNLDEIADRFK